MGYKPYLRFHVDEVRFDGNDGLMAFTPREITWEEKQVRPIPDSEVRRIGKAEGIPVALDAESIKRYWAQIEGGVRDYLIREYWSPGAKK